MAGTKSLNASNGIRIRIFLVGDNVATRERLAAFLGKVWDFRVAGAGLFEADTLQKVALSAPDVVVLTMDTSDFPGLEVIREIHRLGPPVQLVVVSARLVAEEVFRILQSGVKGYVLAGMVEEEIVTAVRTVRTGRRYLSAAASSALIDDYIQKSLSTNQAKDPLFLLNMREREILQLVAEGKGSGVIAATLNLSVSTVNTYRCRVMKKLGLRDLTELVRFAIRNGLTPLSSGHTMERVIRG